jgi:hypothetical protein
LLDRLLSTNPYAVPLIDASSVITTLWLVSTGIVFLLSLAVVTPRRLRPDSQSVLEVGVIATALLLMSPLTEPQYHVFLIVSWVSLYVSLPERPLFSPPFLWVLLGSLGLWALEIKPPGDGTFSLVPSLLIAVAAFALQLYGVALISGTPTHVAVGRLVRDAPGSTVRWLRDLAAIREW